MELDRYRKNPLSSSLPCGDDAFQLYAPPIVEGVPKLLFTDDEVAVMLGISVSTVRNRYNPSSEWYDVRFPVPRSTDGSGKGRKAAVRWHWGDLCRYAGGLPPVTYSRPLGKSGRTVTPRDICEHSDKPFIL